jgi:hypothetical protein
MTYLKCASCKVRLYSDGRPDALPEERCPDCGTTLELVGELTELVGYRSVTRAELAEIDTERWADDGGSLAAAARDARTWGVVR